jgi:uncharacterized protein (DUF885 family)
MRMTVWAVTIGVFLLGLGTTVLSQAQTDRRPTPGQSSTSDLNVPELQRAPSELAGLIERFDTDNDILNRTYRVAQSPVRQARMKEFISSWFSTLQKLNFNSMAEEGRIDYLLFKNHLENEKRQLDIQEKRLVEAAPLIPFAQTILDLDDARSRLEPIDPAKIAAQLNTLNSKIADARKAVEGGLTAKKTVGNRAVNIVNSLKDALKSWYDFYNSYDPLFTWWAVEPYKKVDASLQSYATLLREKVVGLKAGDRDTIIGDPIGREALMSELAHEMIPYTPEELVDIANQEFAWCENEMKKASQAMGYGDDWHKALEHVKTLYVEPGKQPQLIRDLALEATKFVEDRNLVTVPPLAKESWRMEMMTPERQRVNPFFTGGEIISVSFPTAEMPHEQKMMSMRGNNIHFSRATVFHELIPGHHLQLFMADRYHKYRKLFYTPFYVEGWALYWEMLLWDKNFAKSPENRVGMLFWRMHRCARIIFSLSFHLEKMTPQEAIDFLVNRVGHERENATAEVRRSFAGDYSPLYQCAYMLGGLQLRALHRELVDSGKMTDRAFHDAVLKENAIPIEMIRADLTKQPLTSTFASSWKFYGLNPGR